MLQTVASDGAAVLDLVELAAWRAPSAWMDRLRRVLLPRRAGPPAVPGLVEELTSQRAADRVGERVVVLVEEHDEEDPTVAVGRAEHQGPDVDGVCLVRAPRDGAAVSVGSFVEGVVVDAVGVDLVVEVR